MQTRFDAVILAGYDRNRPDPLTVAQGQPHKALIDIQGKPMIWWVVTALTMSNVIDHVVIVGLGPEDGLDFGREVYYVPDQGAMLDNVAQGFELLATWQSRQNYGLLITADVPLVTGGMIDWFVNACQPLKADLYWGVVEQSTMEKLFPSSKRTYLRLVEGRFCSGDLFLGKITVALDRHGLIRRVVEQRKNVLQQLRLLGLGVVLRFLFRRLRMQDLLGVVRRALKIEGAPIIVPFAQVGMDVDKPHQLEQVLVYLAKHAA